VRLLRWARRPPPRGLPSPGGARLAERLEPGPAGGGPDRRHRRRRARAGGGRRGGVTTPRSGGRYFLRWIRGGPPTRARGPGPENRTGSRRSSKLFLIRRPRPSSSRPLPAFIATRTGTSSATTASGLTASTSRSATVRARMARAEGSARSSTSSRQTTSREGRHREQPGGRSGGRYFRRCYAPQRSGLTRWSPAFSSCSTTAVHNLLKHVT
jgi:hypothetical protein